MGLGREVDDRGAARRGALDRVRVGDVALEELVVDAFEVGGVARIRELVEDGDLGAARGEPAHEVRADEPGSTGDEHAHRHRVAAANPCDKVLQGIRVGWTARGRRAGRERRCRRSSVE